MATPRRDDVHKNHTRRDGSLVQAVTIAEKAAEEWARKIEDVGYEMRRQSMEAKNSAARYVKTRPFKSLGLAALAGAFIALLLRR